MTDIHPVQCEFCNEPAVWKNCCFYPASYEDTVSGPFNLCDFHLAENDDYYVSTGDELPIAPSEADYLEANK